MANYSSKDATYSFNAHAITGNVLVASPVSREVIAEDVTPFGVTDEVWFFTGVKRAKELTWEGLYDDTAVSGTDAVFIGLGTVGSLVAGFGGTKTATVQAGVRVYDRVTKMFGATRYRATLRPTGAWTEA